MGKLGAKLAEFMRGRYGIDALGRFILYCSIALLLIGMIIRPLHFLYYVAVVLVFYGYYRMFSRNVTKRYNENQKFLSIVNTQKARFAQRKTHKIFKCPNCSQKIRVPKGKGKICIKCPKCRIEFIKKT